MRIEDITKDNVKGLSDKELRYLIERARQLYRATEGWRRMIAKRQIGIKDPIPRSRFMQSYDILIGEAKHRGISISYDSALDKDLIKKSIWKVDTQQMPILILKEGVISFVDDFATKPLQTSSVQLGIAKGLQSFAEKIDIEKRLAEILCDVVDGGLSVRDLEGVEDCVPLYDLALVPKEEFRRKQLEFIGEEISKEVQDTECVIDLVDIYKPYPNEHAARIRDPKEFDDFRRQNNKFGDGIHVIWGIKGRRAYIQSIRFDADKFSIEEVRRWLKEHDYEPLELVEATRKAEEAREDGEAKESERKKATFIKNEEQRLVGGIVYEVGKVDSQGDFVDSPYEIWKAMEGWMLRGHPISFMHDGRRVNVAVIENFQAEEDTKKGGEIVPAGAWYLACKVLDNQLWEAIKRGEITGFSMAGRAFAEEVES